MDDRQRFFDLRSPTVALVVCALMTVATYASHVASAGFVYEDRNDLATAYRGWQGVGEELHTLVAHPTRALSSAVARLAGPSPWRQHAVSLALHVACGLVLATVLWPIAPWTGVVAAGVFWLHPVQTEAVAYASAQGDVLLTVCVLLGVLAVERDRPGWAWLAALGAALSKETGIVAWALLPAVAWARGCRWAPLTRIWWALSVLVPLTIGLLAYGATLPWPTADGLRWLAALLWLAVWPVGLAIEHAVPAWWTLVLAAVALTAGAVRWPRATLAIAGWIVLAWLPRLLVPLMEPPHERHLYLPMVAVSVAVAAVATLTGRRSLV